MGFNKKFFQTGGIVASSPAAAAAFDPLQNFETVTYTGNGGTQKITGYIRKGAAFNGSSSKIEIGTELIPATSNFSLSFWIYRNTSVEIDLFNQATSSGDIRTYFKLYTNGTLGVYSAGTNGSRIQVPATTSTVTNSQWEHIAIVRDGSNMTFYINSTAETETISGGTIGVGRGDLQIISNTALNGKLDQVRIFNKALSSSEVTTLYGETYASSTKSTTDIFGDGSGVALYELDDSANDTAGAGTNGKFGDAAFFNGSSSDIALPALGNNYPVSYSAWIYPSPIVASAIINDTLGSNRFLVGLQSSSFSRTNYILVAQGGQAHYGTPTNSVTANTWNHILVVANSVNNYTIYINGVSQTVSNLGGTAGGSASYNIGSSVSTEFFSGRIDDVRIYSDALTSTEVGYIYNNTTASIPTDNLVAYYKLDGDATDETGTYDGTATNVSWGYDGTATNVNFLGMAFQPDLVWIKERTATGWHHLFDSVRGTGKALFSNATNTELSRTDSLTSFDSNGFSLGADSNGDGVNRSYNYVAWSWKAGGAAVSNTDGSITSQVSANQDAGFSIVKWNSNGTVGATVGHGLSSAPEMIIIKDTSDTKNWLVYHSGIGATSGIQLNLTAAAATASQYWNNTAPTASVFSLSDWSNESGSRSMIGYCFHSVDGYQKIGSYTPTTGDDVVTLGFRPRFVMLKRATGGTGNWEIHDGTRYPSIYTDTGESRRLRANAADAEAQFTDSPINFTDTGFVLDSSTTGDGYVDYDSNGSTYIYLAIA